MSDTSRALVNVVMAQTTAVIWAFLFLEVRMMDDWARNASSSRAPSAHISASKRVVSLLTRRWVGCSVKKKKSIRGARGASASQALLSFSLWWLSTIILVVVAQIIYFLIDISQKKCTVSSPCPCPRLFLPALWKHRGPWSKKTYLGRLEPYGGRS